jgi:hypothetical protein
VWRVVPFGATPTSHLLEVESQTTQNGSEWVHSLRWKHNGEIILIIHSVWQRSIPSSDISSITQVTQPNLRKTRFLLDPLTRFQIDSSLLQAKTKNDPHVLTQRVRNGFSHFWHDICNQTSHRYRGSHTSSCRSRRGKMRYHFTTLSSGL